MSLTKVSGIRQWQNSVPTTALIILFYLTAQISFSQTDTLLKIEGYAEVFYAYDFSRPTSSERQPYLYNFNRHNEFNLNLGAIKVSTNRERSRANLVLMTGTYAADNLAGEPSVLRNIYEANIGVRLYENRDLWLDVGVLESHIGFESAYGNRCLNLTRSIMAENSPYFLTGARLAYTSASEQWHFSLSMVNGWQRIQRVQGNSLPSFGHQATWQPNDKWTINSSSFIGTDDPDPLRRMRYFHNFYIIYNWSTYLDIIMGYDVGVQQIAKGSSEYNRWETLNINARWSFHNKWMLGARVEYYADPASVIIANPTNHPFSVWGGSFNIDYQISDTLMWRIEVRQFNASQSIFNNSQDTVNRFVASALSISF